VILQKVRVIRIRTSMSLHVLGIKKTENKTDIKCQFPSKLAQNSSHSTGAKLLY